MALDESRDSDEIFHHSGLVLLIDKQFLQIAKPIRIDLDVTDRGREFLISSPIAENHSVIAEDPSACYASCTI